MVSTFIIIVEIVSVLPLYGRTPVVSVVLYFLGIREILTTVKILRVSIVWTLYGLFATRLAADLAHKKRDRDSGF